MDKYSDPLYEILVSNNGIKIQEWFERSGMSRKKDFNEARKKLSKEKKIEHSSNDKDLYYPSSPKAEVDFKTRAFRIIYIENDLQDADHYMSILKRELPVSEIYHFTDIVKAFECLENHHDQKQAIHCIITENNAEVDGEAFVNIFEELKYEFASNNYFLRLIPIVLSKNNKKLKVKKLRGKKRQTFIHFTKEVDEYIFVNTVLNTCRDYSFGYMHASLR